MSVFDHIPMGRTGLDELYVWLDRFSADHQALIEKRNIGNSETGLDIPALFITDRSVPDEDKQTAVVTLGRHGQELGTRVIGAEIMAYLISDEAAQLRRNQLFIVVPVANPDGFVLNEFHSSRTGLTATEKAVFGPLFRDYPPDMVLDYHSLGQQGGPQTDTGDIEVIIPANTGSWAMDEQIHSLVALEMQRDCEAQGWPYDIHTLQEVATYFMRPETPWRVQEEKVFVLQQQDAGEVYDGYTNFTSAPAYRRWRSLVFGIEANHFGLGDAGAIAESGLAPFKALARFGQGRLGWQERPGYPVGLVHGDFRTSLRPVGRTVSERRTSRTELWSRRRDLAPLYRSMPDVDATVVKLGLRNGPALDCRLCVRVRSEAIAAVELNGRPVEYNTFTDDCSTYVSLELTLDRSGTEAVIRRQAG